MPDRIKRLARTSLSDSIVEQLTSLIARGIWKPGGRMPSEKQLCEQFGVGRTSVREALKSLAVVGLIESHAGDGHFVATDPGRYVDKALQLGLLPDAHKISELIETRLMLESQTAMLAAERAERGDLEEIAGSLQAMEAGRGDYAVYLEADLRFHLAVARASQNSILLSLLGSIRTHLQSWVQQALTQGSQARAEASIAEHHKILQAITRRRPLAARRAMEKHILSSSEVLRKRARG